MSCDSNFYPKLVYYILLSTSCISCICCLCTFAIYIKFKNIRSFSLSIVFYMAIADLIRASFLCIPIYLYKTSYICSIYAYVFSCTYVINACWSFCITFSLYQQTIKFNEIIEKYQKTWLIISFVIIPLLQSGPLFTDSFGYNLWLCDLKDSENNVFWKIFLDYAPVWTSVISVIYMQIRVYLYLSKVISISLKEIILEKGMIYSIIIIFTFLPISLLRILGFFYDPCQLFGLIVISYAVINLQGFFNFIALLSNQNIWFAIKYNSRRSEFQSYGSLQFFKKSESLT